MTLFKNALAVTAAGLMVSQSAAALASPVRAAAPVAESEELGGSAGLMPFLAVFAIFLAVGAVALLEDDDDDFFPVSP